MYLIGEAMLGKGAEAAHINLLIGDRDSLVGSAITQGILRGKTRDLPFPASIRSNLLSKPITFIIPKLDISNTPPKEKTCEAIEHAIGKAIADAVEEKIIPSSILDKWLVLCSIYLDPKAEDRRKLYAYHYSAVKLALQRALTAYPPLSKILYEKNRARNPLMDFRHPQLWRPPYLQIALDNPAIESAINVIHELPQSDGIILEAGTPLIKSCGLKAIRQLRSIVKDLFLIADLKTLDACRLEVDKAMEAGADGVVVSGLASSDQVEEFILEAKRVGIYSIVDMMAVSAPSTLLDKLKFLPHVVILHRGIDQEETTRTRWDLVKDTKKKYPHLLIAVAGGITPNDVSTALQSGADIIIVGRYITQARDVRRATLEFTKVLGEDIDLHRIHVE
jgi:bifunctional enzyme Fae/Hps